MGMNPLSRFTSFIQGVGHEIADKAKNTGSAIKSKIQRTISNINLTNNPVTSKDGLSNLKNRKTNIQTQNNSPVKTTVNSQGKMEIAKNPNDIDTSQFKVECKSYAKLIGEKIEKLSDPKNNHVSNIPHSFSIGHEGKMDLTNKSDLKISGEKGVMTISADRFLKDKVEVNGTILANDQSVDFIKGQENIVKINGNEALKFTLP